jgi:site-specific DNA recombinase
MLEAVYVDANRSKSIVAVRPKPPFKPVFQVAASKKESKIRILNEPPEGSSVFLVEKGETLSLPETRYIVNGLLD